MGDELEALVLRKNYSANALARKARELADQESDVQKARPTPLAGELPPILGTEDSSVIVDESKLPGGARRTPTAMAARGRAPQPARWRVFVAGFVPAMAIGALLGFGLRPSAPSAVALPTAPAPPPPPAPPTPAPPPANVAPPTVRVALNSAPTGATVTGAAGPLGRTPLLLQLPRSEEVVELTLTKPGFAPLPFKVVPAADRELVANLRRVAARRPNPATAGAAAGAAAAAGGKPAPGASNSTTTKTVRVTTTTTSSTRTTQTVAPPAPAARAPKPAAAFGR
jgi:hypothetical protein